MPTRGSARSLPGRRRPGSPGPSAWAPTSPRRSRPCGSRTSTAWPLDVVATVGLHPHEASTSTRGLGAVLDAEGAHRVVAIGECGLDYYYEHSPRDAQLVALRRAAGARGRATTWPSCCTSATRSRTSSRSWTTSGCRSRTIVHCFSAGPAEARRCVEAGMTVSIAGIVTFKNAEALRDALAEVPLDRLLVETDSPFLAPVPHRGRTNEPAFVADRGSRPSPKPSTSTSRSSRRRQLSTPRGSSRGRTPPELGRHVTNRRVTHRHHWLLWVIWRFTRPLCPRLASSRRPSLGSAGPSAANPVEGAMSPEKGGGSEGNPRQGAVGRRRARSGDHACRPARAAAQRRRHCGGDRHVGRRRPLGDHVAGHGHARARPSSSPRTPRSSRPPRPSSPRTARRSGTTSSCSARPVVGRSCATPRPSAVPRGSPRLPDGSRTDASPTTSPRSGTTTPSAARTGIAPPSRPRRGGASSPTPRRGSRPGTHGDPGSAPAPSSRTAH